MKNKGKQSSDVKSDSKKKLIKFWIIGLSALFFLSSLIVGFTLLFYVYKFTQDLPDILELKDYSPSLASEVFDDNDKPVSQFYVERRILTPLSQIPALMRNATIAVEDSNFKEHKGVDFMGIFRAFLTNVRAGGVVEGGSTITQQLAKTMFLTPERKLKRKIKELILALQIERKFTKNEILEIYLNQIYYGHGAYGVESAAQTYFGRSIRNLSTEEIALIAALPKAPSLYSPYSWPDKAKKRRNHVLKRLSEEGYLDEKVAAKLSELPIKVQEKSSEEMKAPYFSEYIRKYIEDTYGTTKLYKSGFKIYTTINLAHQIAAEEAVRHGIEVTDHRLGYRGPIANLPLSGKIDWELVENTLETKFPEGIPFEPSFDVGGVVPGVVTLINPNSVLVELKEGKGEIPLTGMDWAHKRDKAMDAEFIPKLTSTAGVFNRGDIIWVKINRKTENNFYDLSLTQYPIVQGALVSINPKNGYIKAMVGGYDFANTKFNRAVQARRQPGSAFKPVIYAAAIEKGYSPSDVFVDSPLIFEEDGKKNWKPKNFEKEFYGPITLRSALTHSRNIVTVKLLQKIGIEYFIDFTDRFGIKEILNHDLSLALGTSTLTPLELTSIYGTFANSGILAKPMAIKYITDNKGKKIEESFPQSRQALTPEAAYIISSMTQSVVKDGTGYKAAVLNRPVGGKTGTTNDCIDAWFLGFTPDIVTGVWVGMDYKDTLGKNETGSKAAAPIWVEFMKSAVLNTPVTSFPVPAGIVFKKINKKSGLLALPGDTDTIFETFVKGKEPIEFSVAIDKNEKTDEYRF